MTISLAGGVHMVRLGNTTMSISSINELSKTLAYYRDRARLSLRELAKRSGVNHSTISGLEQGRIKPPKNALNALADALVLSQEEREDFVKLVGLLPQVKVLKPTTKGLESSILIKSISMLASIPREEIKEVWLQKAAEDEYDVVLKLRNRGVLGLQIGESGRYCSASGFSQDELPPPHRATRLEFITRQVDTR